ncbi:hypothetical protein E3Q22_03286 [Wallemia mellicola]|uniref:Uncharacterized protein n=2 Tax=Wallemia mellicola TaxID=1708541 RepID=A0A4T0LRU6_9BASI|nr:hypothetical protein WALSEDRAFT_70453 [Wallemia mellicola CBS 633.66]TIB67875.1 hypothetical protein E3Q24_03958 [Wallemia mellicola]EIM19644.1 hypothetical protein WALSEDRAFT_70453 [Wallemia mellicola CBS 633.66]TIB72467.1 hypothetical protein E3Q23_03382 [Wallemia mellicola]TIB76985.1 hypothetical protein E3Q22_03286 [Wallemia mellicola]TIB82214.1 hypothetical protein E3Q21_03514 [Wallemia mellicola]|eukprot:XP_006960307.1 hypothetical protein WALSEDRAFT_70453 [Wallemia mellicola CBS 633.66]
MTKLHYLLLCTTYHDPDVCGFNSWKRQWQLPCVSRINEKKKREYIDLIIHGVASDWVKSCLKDKEGKLYNPECLQVEGPPLVTNSAPDGNYIPLVKVDDRIELLSAQPIEGGSKKQRKLSKQGLK